MANIKRINFTDGFSSETTPAETVIGASSFLVGSGVPSSGTGNDGDYYVDADTGIIYLKASGSWSNVDQFALPASAIVNTPSGTVSGTDVQAAIDELEAEKYNKTGGTISGDVTIDDGAGGGDLTVTGDLTVNGTTTTLDTTTLDVKDANITVNNGGTQSTANSGNSGITVEMSDATDAGIGYDSGTTSRFKIGDIGSQVEIADISSAQVITNKDIDGGTASNTNRVTLPRDTTTNLDLLVDKEGTVAYDTTQNALVVNDGANWALPLADADIILSSEIFNIGISNSVGSSALTINLKQSDGTSDPTVGNPSKIAFRGSTSASGAYNVRSITSALSVVIPSGATLGHANATEGFIYVYAVDNSGTISLAVSSIEYDEHTLNTVTAIAASSDDSTLYGTALTLKPIRLIARLKSTQTTAGTYASVASEISLKTLNDYHANNEIQAKGTASAVPTTSSTYSVVTSIVVPPGPHLISGFAEFLNTGLPTGGIYYGNVFISAYSGSTTTDLDVALTRGRTFMDNVASEIGSAILTPFRINPTTTTTYYLKTSISSASSGNVTVEGYRITAEKIRY